MKLNLDFYKEELDKKDVSDKLLEKVISYPKEDFSQLISNESDIEEILALSDVRKNILNWYKFKENSEILEINANYGEITGLLCEKARKVVSIENSKKCASIIEKRHKNIDNLELIIGDLSQIKLERKFDYIVIIGIYNGVEQVLEYANKKIKEDGIILLALNNKFGVKSWVTTKEQENVINNNNISCTEEQLKKILQGKQYKVYYPLPDYKLPNIIYTEKCMPNISNIYRNLTYKNGTVNFKEIEAYYEIIKNNPENFKNYANSFLLEISQENIKENDIKFIAFSNMRKDEYRIQTIVKEKEVCKYSINSKSQEHIDKIKQNIETLNNIGINTLDSYQNGKIVSKYVTEPSLEDKLISIYKEQGKDQFLEQIDKFKSFLKEKLQVTEQIEQNIFTKYNVKCEGVQNLTFVKHGFWDLIFQNCFIIENEYYFYDQEWYEQNVPIEYILYRAILYFNESKKYITDEEIFEYLGLTQFIHTFRELDDKLQQKTRKDIVWKLHSTDDLEKTRQLQEEKDLQKMLKEKEYENANLKIEIEKLKMENTHYCNEIFLIKNSLSWKATEPLRKIRGLGKK